MSAEVSAALALALGIPIEGRELSWPLVLRVAQRERCAALAWLRSAAVIRARAPANVVAAWRVEAMSAIDLAEFWQRVLVETLSSLTAEGVQAVVLKGLPLAQRLYGNAAARPCADLDLYVPGPRREAAHRALVAAGWRWRIGVAPGEAGYTTERGRRTVLLEVHSSLLDDPLVAHLPFSPPGARALDLGGVQVAAHDDAQLPAYLATHLAKHAMPPLLWFIDFLELWSALSPAERDAAWAAARVARARRYLAWAVDRSGDIAAAARFEPLALARLGIGERGRADGHSAARVARLAAGASDALRVVTGWLSPTRASGEWAALPLLLADRVRKLAWRTLGTRRSYADAEPRPAQVAPSRRAVVFDARDFHAIVDELSRQDARFSIRATGHSMQPSLAPGTLVMLAPRRERSLTVGDVVLARTKRGTYLLHRVRRIGADWVETQGDANMLPDERVPIGAVAAIAEAVVVDGRERGIPAARGIRARRLVAGGVRMFRRKRREVGRASARDSVRGGTGAR